jgi:two-component system chemotaxis response regulator CheY
MSENDSRYILENINVMVIDDNRYTATLITKFFAAIGIKNVLGVADEAKALKELTSSPVDVIVVDWNMQPLNGLDFVRLVRNAMDTPNPYVPIIMLSGHTEYRRVTEARDARMNDILPNPSRPRPSINASRPSSTIRDPSCAPNPI